MRVTRSLSAVLALTAAAFLAGCGGGGGGSALPAGASVVPEDVAAYVSVITDFGSPQIKRAQALLSRFPASRLLFANARREMAKEGVDFERDVKPALGDELDVVWLDFANDGNDVVALLRPHNEAKLVALLRKGDEPPVHEVVDGWTVLSDDRAKLDRFRQMRGEGGSLNGNGEFQEVVRDLPEGSLVRAFVSGSAIQARIDAALAGNPAASFTASQLPSIKSFGAALAPGSNGVHLDAAARGDFKTATESFRPELPAALPSGAIAYLGFSNLEDAMRRALAKAGEVNPNFDQQRAQLETALGFSLDKDILPLFSGESAVAVYPLSANVPAIAFVQSVSDEDKARRLIGRITALSRLGGNAQVSILPINGAQATEIRIRKDLAFYLAAFRGKIVLATDRTVVSGMASSASKLAGDPAFEKARAEGGLPGETGGFFYLNLRTTQRWLADLVQRTGKPVPRRLRENLEPLRSLLLYSRQEGDRLRLSGFLGIR